MGYRPFVKPTSRHLPLGSDSEHPFFIHRAWPLAEIRRMKCRSLAYRDFLIFRALKISRFEEVFLDSGVTAGCKSWSPDQLRPAREDDTARIIYLPVPWNPDSAYLINLFVSRWNRTWAVRLRSIGVDIKLRVSWQLGGTPLRSRVMRINSISDYAD